MHWILAGYMWLFIHRPFEVWPWLAELRIERVYMLFSLTVWLFLADKGWIRNRLNVGVLAFFLALLLTSIFSLYPEKSWKIVEDYFKVGVFYVLLLSTIRDKEKLRFFVIAFIVCMGLYIFHSLWEYRNGRHKWTMGTARLIGVDTSLGDPNSFAASVVYALPLLVPLWKTAKSILAKSALLLYATLSVVSILLTGSRTGLVGMLVAGLFLVALSKHRLIVLLLLVAIAPVVWSALPEDRQMRFMTIIDPSVGPVNAQESADSRMRFFEISVRLWTESPLIGYGPGSFPITSETGMDTHSLFGQLLAELGLAGILTFLVILWGYVRNTVDVIRTEDFKEQQSKSFEYWLTISILFNVFLLLLLGLTGHNLFRYTWLWIGAFQAAALHFCLMDESAPDSQNLELENVIAAR